MCRQVPPEHQFTSQGRALLSAGQGERARELLGLARETYEKAGDRKALARIAALSRR